MYKSVSEFTKACALSELPEKPTAMNRKAVEFIVSMVLSEMGELLETVCVDEKDRDETMLRLLGTDAHKKIKKPTSLKRKIADQADAMTDAIYYMNDCATKHSMDLDACLKEVHSANMKKVDSTTGKVNRREDGKILKPAGWTGPCLEKVLFPIKDCACQDVDKTIFYNNLEECKPTDLIVIANWCDVVDPDFDSAEPYVDPSKNVEIFTGVFNTYEIGYTIGETSSSATILYDDRIFTYASKSSEFITRVLKQIIEDKTVESAITVKDSMLIVQHKDYSMCFKEV